MVYALQEPQKEQSHLLWPDGTIEKWVVVHVKCKVIENFYSLL